MARIPIGTAFAEELIFRGAMQAVFAQRHGHLTAAVITSVLFGVWHIAPTLRHQTHPLRHGRHAVLVSVLFTTLAGFFLSALRRRSGSLIAPWLVDLAPTTHVGNPPATVHTGGLAALAAVAIGLTLVGFVAFRRRDIPRA